VPATKASGPSVNRLNTAPATMIHLRVLKSRSNGPYAKVPAIWKAVMANSTLPRCTASSPCTSARYLPAHTDSTVAMLA